MKGPYFDTLFDSRSHVNLIFEAIVKKLNLEPIPHPKTYHLGWIQDNAKLQVTRKCKHKYVVTANFIDKVELHVVPLDIFVIVPRCDMPTLILQSVV